MGNHCQAAYRLKPALPFLLPAILKSGLAGADLGDQCYHDLSVLGDWRRSMLQALALLAILFQASAPRPNIVAKPATDTKLFVHLL